jgi:DNA-binding Xre family transcriptional regulator
MKIDIKKLDIILARKNINYTGLAAIMGITYRSLYHLLHQSKNPRPTTIGVLARNLGVDVADIIEP